MSLYAIGQYHKELEKIIYYCGSKKESRLKMESIQCPLDKLNW